MHTKPLVALALVSLSALAATPRATRADDCLSDAVADCDVAFPSRYPVLIVARGWCYLARVSMCLTERPT